MTHNESGRVDGWYAASGARAAGGLGSVDHETVRARYAADPLLPLLEGHVKVLDAQRFEPVTFDPWPNQVELIRAWITPEFLAGEGLLANVHLEKSRQEGDSWAVCYCVLWLLTYRTVPLLMLSERMDEVDDGGRASSIDSLFGKIRFMWENWPGRIGRARLSFVGGNDAMIRNLDSPLSFATAASGHDPDPGRGGRYAGAVIDEAARIRFDREAHRALARACPQGRLLLSTPKGEGNVYFRLREDRPRGWVFLRHHWTEHPIYSAGIHMPGELEDCERCRGVLAGVRWTPGDDEGPTHRYPGKLTSPWYDDAVTDLPNEDVAQELDIDYGASLVGRVFPEFSEETHVEVDEPLVYDANRGPVQNGWDFGIGDPTSIVICQETPTELLVLDDLELSDARPEQIVAALKEVLAHLGVPASVWERSDEGLLFNVGDPFSLGARSIATGTTLAADYAALGVPIAYAPISPGTRIKAAQRLFMGAPKRIVVAPRARDFIRHAKAWTWPSDSRGVRRPGATRPNHDEHSHMMDAFTYLVGYKWPVVQAEEAVEEATRRTLSPALGEYVGAGSARWGRPEPEPETEPSAWEQQW